MSWFVEQGWLGCAGVFHGPGLAAGDGSPTLESNPTPGSGKDKLCGLKHFMNCIAFTLGVRWSRSPVEPHNHFVWKSPFSSPIGPH